MRELMTCSDMPCVSCLRALLLLLISIRGQQQQQQQQ
jgi:hypothetical protein